MFIYTVLLICGVAMAGSVNQTLEVLNKYSYNCKIRFLLTCFISYITVFAKVR